MSLMSTFILIGGRLPDNSGSNYIQVSWHKHTGLLFLYVKWLHQYTWCRMMMILGVGGGSYSICLLKNGPIMPTGYRFSVKIVKCFFCFCFSLAVIWGQGLCTQVWQGWSLCQDTLILFFVDTNAIVIILYTVSARTINKLRTEQVKKLKDLQDLTYSIMQHNTICLQQILPTVCSTYCWLNIQFLLWVLLQLFVFCLHSVVHFEAWGILSSLSLHI